jgi:hypothetical protein
MGNNILRSIFDSIDWNIIDAFVFIILISCYLILVYKGIKLIADIVHFFASVFTYTLLLYITYSLLVNTLDFSFLDKTPMGNKIFSIFRESIFIKTVGLLSESKSNIFGVINSLYQVIECKTGNECPTLRESLIKLLTGILSI